GRDRHVREAGRIVQTMEGWREEGLNRPSVRMPAVDGELGEDLWDALGACDPQHRLRIGQV
ncbi:MAG: hypothetical protein ACI80K_003531, partial [Paracoccaceae bacterium]